MGSNRSIDLAHVSRLLCGVNDDAADMLSASMEGCLGPSVALIIANGPSTKDLKFSEVERPSILTVGMNSAYRYWETIDFRPTHYICMDTTVIMSHADAIYKLVREGRIKKFFLRDEIKSLYPDLAAEKKILWFDYARNHIEVFDSHFVTTGSWAIRWMAHEGVKAIATIGIDANYVEILPNARSVDGNLKLEIAKTPTANPNYFFDSYQQAGDKYNIPNDPEYLRATGRLVHVDALRKAKDDIHRLFPDSSVFDLSPISAHGVFKKKSLQEFLKSISVRLVTSFYAGADSDVLRANVLVACVNSINSEIDGVSVVFEGSDVEFDAACSGALSPIVTSLRVADRLRLSFVKSRPSYRDLFKVVDGEGGLSIVTNSDIVLPMSVIQGAREEAFDGWKGAIALTRWNKTRSGAFLQGMSGAPPWPVLEVDQISLRDRNVFSFDTYIVTLPFKIPLGFEKIAIGTLGCDTALAAILKINGISVRNPCLNYRTLHYDEKPRSYDDDKAKLDQRTNIEICKAAVYGRFKSRPSVLTAFDATDQLQPSKAWFGHPRTPGFWHALFRALGALSWTSARQQANLVFTDVKLQYDEIVQAGWDPKWLEERLRQNDLFIKWTLEGSRDGRHIFELFNEHPRYASLLHEVKHHQWQSFLNVSTVTPYIHDLYNTLLSTVEMMLGSDPQPAARAGKFNRRPKVVIPFHKGDQISAALLIENILSIDDGCDGEATYFLQFGDGPRALSIQAVIDRFASSRDVKVRDQIDAIAIPDSILEDDPNSGYYEGLHTIRTPDQKLRIFQWNLVVLNFIEELDDFLIVEPDCLILKEGWLREIWQAYEASNLPIFGHLKTGKIGGRFLATHFAGCSVYNGRVLRKLPLRRTLFERFDNPWWTLRSEPESETAGNVFWGPVFSGFDISYDYFLYAAMQIERSGSTNPLDWKTDGFDNRADLILCDFRSRLTIEEIEQRHLGVTCMVHGIKDDAARHYMVRRLRNWCNHQKHTLSGRFLCPPFDHRRSVLDVQSSGEKLNRISAVNDRLVTIEDLRGAFHGRRVVILGSALDVADPSLQMLNGECTIGLGSACAKIAGSGFHPTFFVCADLNILERCAGDIDRLGGVKVVSDKGGHLLDVSWNVFLMHGIQDTGFSRNLDSYQWHDGLADCYCALQLAYHLGFDEVVLLGDEGDKRRSRESYAPEENQTCDVRFGEAAVCELHESVLSQRHYLMARDEFERVGRRFTATTMGGFLDTLSKESVFDETDAFAETLGGPLTETAVKPIVSVIMPAKNVSNYIGRAIASVLKQQEIIDVELIVIIDAGCDDDTARVARRWAGWDHRVRVEKNARRPGVSGSRNTGLDLASGEFIAFLDADDFWLENSLDRRVSAIRARRDVGMVHGYVDFVDIDERSLEFGVGHKRDVTFLDAYVNPACINTWLIRSHLVKEARFTEELSNGEDWLFLSRLLRRGVKSGYVDRGGATYRVRKNSAVLGDFLKHESFLVRVLDFVFSDTDDKDVSSFYRQGLQNPPREEVIFRRRLNVLFWLLLNGDGLGFANLVLKLHESGFLNSLDCEEVIATARVVAGRFYACPLSEIAKAASAAGSRLARVLDRSVLGQVSPEIDKGLRELFALSGRVTEGNHEFSTLELPRSLVAQHDECRFVYVLLRESPTRIMIDVGAHFGGSLGHFAGAGWTVYAFEPDPANRAKLVARIRDKPNVILSQEAVSDTAGQEVAFYASDESTGISGLSAFRDTHREVARVRTITLDAVVARHAIARIDFLKIDVEGFEMAVLRGLDFDRIKPAVVLAEYEDDKTRPHGYDVHDLCRFLTARGYHVYVSEWHPIERYGIKHSFRRIQRYPCEVPPDSWGNLIAFQTDPAPERLKAAIRAAVDRPVRFVDEPETGVAPAPAVKPEPVKPAAVMPALVKPAPIPKLVPAPPAAMPRPVAPATSANPPAASATSGMPARVAIPTSATAQPALRRAVILGNGPSLKDFDLTRLTGIDSFGMNAAYRHWDRIGWYPTHYACLDEVVGLSHRDEIARLIRDRARLGIRKFLLRANLIEALGAEADTDAVVDFDALRRTGKRYARDPVTTGSHCLIWAAELGYREIVLLGVDADYTELVPGAERGPGLELRIGASLPNPNYFFEDYQRVGDRFQVPNASPGVHVGSWRAAAAAASELGAIVLNANEKSKVDAFDFCAREALFDSAPIASTPRTLVLDRRRRAALQRKVRLSAPSSGDRATRAASTAAAALDAATSGAIQPGRQELAVHMSDSSARRFRSSRWLAIGLVGAAGIAVGATVASLVVAREAGENWTASIAVGMAVLFLLAAAGVAWRIRESTRRSHERRLREELRARLSAAEAQAETIRSQLRVELARAVRDLKGTLQERTREQRSTAAKAAARLEETARATQQALGTVADVEQRLAIADRSLADQIEQTAAAIETRSQALTATQLDALRSEAAAVATRLDSRLDETARATQQALGTVADVERRLATADRSLADQIEQTAAAIESRSQALTASQLGALRSEAAVVVARLDSRLEETARATQRALGTVADAEQRLSTAERSLANQIEQAAGAIESRSQALTAAQLEALRIEAAAVAARLDSRLDEGEQAAQQALERLSDMERRTSELDELNRTISNRFEQLLPKYDARHHDLVALSEALAGRQAHIAGELDAWRQRLASDDRGLSERIEAIISENAALHDKLLALQEQAARDIGHRLETSISAAAQRAAELRDDVFGKVNQAEKRIQDLDENGIKPLLSRLDATHAEQNKIQLQAAQAEIHANSSLHLLSRMNASNAALARPHVRLLDAASLDRILTHWLPMFGLSMSRSGVSYLAHRICLMEDQCEGRVATTINALILRLLAMRSLGPSPELKVLEIGTLFGIGGGLFHAFRGPDIARVRLTIIDPLSGYYSKGQLDPVTGVPISPETVADNLSRLRVPREDFKILRGLSQDPAIKDKAATSRYNLILIDGDHSREGVRRDFELYAPLLEPGGILLFDDYDTSDWPEVKESVDRILADAKGWKWLGSDWRTGILKSTEEPEKAVARPARVTKNRRIRSK